MTPSSIERPAEMPPRYGLVRKILGPLPAETLSAMAGYGLDDGEIAAYFGLTPSSVRRLRRTLADPEEI